LPRAQQWRAGADKIKAEVLDKGISSRGVFRQHYKTDDLDASLLLPIMGFLPPDLHPPGPHRGRIAAH
jgi:GH15 family glucan-1,4-alpha-glucosidase